MLHDVVEARVVGGHRVFLRFDDGVAGEVDLARLITFDGVFAPLRAADRFAEVRVNPEAGTIEWPNGADIAPETLYDAVREGAGSSGAAG
jgi:Protein of unknown function (DUF2442)